MLQTRTYIYKDKGGSRYRRFKTRGWLFSPLDEGALRKGFLEAFLRTATLDDLIYKCLSFHAVAVRFAVQWVVQRAEDLGRDEDVYDLSTTLVPSPADYFYRLVTFRHSMGHLKWCLKWIVPCKRLPSPRARNHPFIGQKYAICNLHRGTNAIDFNLMLLN